MDDAFEDINMRETVKTTCEKTHRTKLHLNSLLLHAKTDRQNEITLILIKKLICKPGCLQRVYTKVIRGNL